MWMGDEEVCKSPACGWVVKKCMKEPEVVQRPLVPVSVNRDSVTENSSVQEPETERERKKSEEQNHCKLCSQSNEQTGRMEKFERK
ncbi:hypothetical protein RRG08_010368 [Elysia crispata]|uniref:Uncharacterized protein n=1 Tax=Elysia crispata TaxID=231223 RepID=A0AAE0Z2M4_9GAST|nr:hypothetical protein RRG08_010368 [Elysia crispata]